MSSRLKWITGPVGAVVFGVMGFLLITRGLSTPQKRLLPTADWMHPLLTTWVLQSPGKDYSVRTNSALQRNGVDSMRFELRGDEKWVDASLTPTYRSEIATENYPPKNSVQWYAFSVYFPTNFPIEDNRLVFAQWHGKAGLFDAKLIPELAFRYLNGKFSVTLRHSAEKSIRDPDAVPSEDLFRKGNFHQGRWHDFVVEAKWSCQQDGFVNIWWNNKQIVEYHGPVGYDLDLSPQFKFGLYRDATHATYVAYYNHVKSGVTPQEMDFDPSAAKHSTE